MRAQTRDDTVTTAGAATDGMVRLAGGTFVMGSDRHYAEEAPARPVTVEPFFIDIRPVSNRDFAAFVAATGYVTLAERTPDPETLPGVDPARLKPGALTFARPRTPPRDLQWPSWWAYTPGAHWRKPEGGPSVFAGRLDHPVVCVAYEDAQAYARWAGKRLPSEAQWEYAARGGLDGADYAWGDAFMPDGRRLANIWAQNGSASFPMDDGPRKRVRTTACGAFPANGHGLYDMIGNVWEWTSDWFTGDHAAVKAGCCHPPQTAFDPALPGIAIPRRVVKGGSFLCAPEYCARYRPAARQPQMIDTAAVHIGFRCVKPT